MRSPIGYMIITVHLVMYRMDSLLQGTRGLTRSTEDSDHLPIHDDRAMVMSGTFDERGAGGGIPTASRMNGKWWSREEGKGITVQKGSVS